MQGRITVSVAGRGRHESVAVLCRPGLDLGALTRLVEQRIGVAVAQVSKYPAFVEPELSPALHIEERLPIFESASPPHFPRRPADHRPACPARPGTPGPPQLRCARTGALIASAEDLVADDVLVAVPAAQQQAASQPDDPAPPTVALSAAADFFSLAQLQAAGATEALAAFAVIGAAVPTPAAPGAVALPVAVRSSAGLAAEASSAVAAAARPIAGRRLVLLIAPAGTGGLADEWSLVSSSVTPHPNCMRLLALLPRVRQLAPDIVSALQAEPASLAAAPEYDILVTEPHVPLSMTVAPKPLPFRDAFSAAVDLARAVAHLNRAGVAHFGVCPAALARATNASSGPLGRLLLAGFSRAVRAPKMDARGLTAVPSGVGRLSDASSFYTAPEVLASAHASRGASAALVPYMKADVYAMGVTLFEVFTGVRPPLAPPLPAGAGVSAGRPSPPSSVDAILAALPADYPHAFVELMSAMMRPDAAQRLSCSGVARRLAMLADGRPVPDVAPYVIAPLPPPRAVVQAPSLVSCPLPEGKSNDDRDDGNDATMADESESKGGEGSGDAEAAAAAGAAVASQLYVYVATAGGGGRLAQVRPVGLVPFSADDSDTVAVALSRACDVLDVNWAYDDVSLVCSEGRIDPQAPMHRLPASVRATVLEVVCGIGTRAPTCLVPGFGVLSPPAAAAQLHPLRLIRSMSGGSGVGTAADYTSAIAAAGILGAGGAAVPLAPGLARQLSAGMIPGPGAGGAAPGSPEKTHVGGSGFASVGLVGLAASDAAAASETGVATPYCSFSRANCSPNISLDSSGAAAMGRGQWGSVLMPQRVSTNGPVVRYAFTVEVVEVAAGAGVVVGFADPLRFDARSHVFSSSAGSIGYSRTGQICGADGDGKWIDYGEPFGTGDVITAEVVGMNKSPAVRFFKNGVPQGVAFRGNEVLRLARAALEGGGAAGAGAGAGAEELLAPCVALGSNAGFRLSHVRLRATDVHEFDRDRAHHRIQFSEDCTTVWNSGKWATALGAHPGLRAGRIQWSVRLDETRSGAGVAVGVVDARNFHQDKQNLGASPHSWCYSKTGKKGCGEGFAEYGKIFTNGDTITMTLDMDACTLSFAVNGDDQGVAYTSQHGMSGCTLVPAVCLGSTEGTKLAKVSIVGPYPALRRFDRWLCSKKVALLDSQTSVETRDKWGTVFGEHGGVKSGKFSFAVLVASAGQGCGAGVGFADLDSFSPETRNLGAAPNSWCYSKTGKFSAGASQGSTQSSFEQYGQPFKSGDVVTAEVNMEAETMRFWLNGRDQGARRIEGLGKFTLVPAVVLGSTEGQHYTKLTLALPAVTRFDPRRSNRHMELREDDRVAYTENRWCSILADHPGVSGQGVLRFAVRLSGEGGAAIGFAEANTFKQYAQNLGAAPNTWAISKTGKISCGDTEGFHPFSDKLNPPDVIGAECDLAAGTIRFWNNGVLLGTAFQGLGGRGLCLVPAVCLGSNTSGKPTSVELVEFNLAWLGPRF